METLTHSGSRPLYSWWWDSHMSPKNSKWLQENLTVMDVKVKAMIKLIEEDADSFARRAEMYYKKRPELMKLLEEIYRAYRALAERYDYATVELRQAHRTMAEAFPNQVPYDLIDESPSETSVSGPEEPHTPEVTHPIRTLSDLDDLSIRLNGICKTGHRQVDQDGFSRLSSENQNFEGFGDSSETEVEYMKGTLSKIEAEKESMFLKYQQALEKLSNLETELKNAQQEAAELDQRASKSEIEVKMLKDALSGMEAERDANILCYNQSLESISNLEDLLSLSQEEAKALDMRAGKAKTETQYLRLQLSSSGYEKEASLRQYKQCLEKISLMEAKISAAEVNSRVLNDSVERAESEVNSLKETINELNKEKELASLKCLETVVKMESEISRAQNNGKKLNDELLTALNKLDRAEVKCSRIEDSKRDLQSEVNNLMEKITMKDQELAQRQVEFEKFQIQMHDEQSRFKQVEISLHTLQDLHSRSQDEEKALTLELKNGLRMLKDLGIHKLSVEEELQKVKEENRSLKNLENEIFSLKQIKQKLEEEVFNKVDYTNTLEQEIHCLREEIKGMNGRYQAMMMEVESVGMNPESLSSSVKELQNENARLRDTFKTERIKGEVLSARLNSSEKISKDNAILENSLAEMNEELEKLREKAKDFQESCHFLQEEKISLVAEKANLLIQLQIVTEKMQKLLEKNTLLENSLCGANVELEALRDHSKSLEEVCQLLKSEKSNLVSERDELLSQLANVELGLGTLEKKFSNLEDKYTSLESENETTIDHVKELRSSIVSEKEEQASYKTLNETRMSGLETDIHILQQKRRLGKKEFEEELEKAVNVQVEIFILRTFVEDLEANNCSLLIESQKLNDASKFSNKLIAELERENLEQQVEIEFLVDEIENLRRGIHRVFKAVQINPEYGQKYEIEREKLLLLNIMDTVEEMKTCLCRSKDEEQQLLIENLVLLTLLGQLGLEGIELKRQRYYVENEFTILKEDLSLNKKEKYDLQETMRQLMFEATHKEQHEKFLAGEIQMQNLNLENLRRDYLVLQKENSDFIKEKRSELEKFSNLKDAYHVLEEEIIEEGVVHDVFSLVFEIFAAEKAMDMKALNQDLDCLHLANSNLKDKVEEMAETLVMKETETLRLNELVEKLDDELHEVKKHNDLLIHEIVLGNNFLRQKVEGLSETEQGLKDLRELNAKLCNRVEELKMECKELTLIRENLDIENLQLCMDGHRQNEEINWLLEMNENLKSEVDLLYNEVGECRTREHNLCSELQERRAGFELWEAEVASYNFDLQASAIREVFLENKLHEITQVCEKIEDENAAKDMEIQNLRESYRILESEMVRLKPEFSATSLKKIVEINSNTNVEVSGSMNDGEEFKSEGTSHLEIARNGRMALWNEFDQYLKPRTKISENGTLMKDIALDQATGFSIYRRSNRESRGANDQMLQLWETAELKTDQSLISNMAHNRTILPLPNNQNNREDQNHSGSSSNIEREPVLGDDRFQRSSSIRERSQGGKKRKILQRLASDAQKLTNLRTTVYDLNKRLETKNWSKKESYIEHEKVYKQLKEVEETVLQLVNMNGELTKNVEQSPSSLAGKTTSELEIENVARNNMMEQTRKASEKIGRLHLEVQNIQLVLLKLEEEKKRKWKMRFSKNKTGIILKDFIYNGKKSNEKDKKNSFCGCQGPPRNED